MNRKKELEFKEKNGTLERKDDSDEDIREKKAKALIKGSNNSHEILEPKKEKTIVKKRDILEDEQSEKKDEDPIKTSKVSDDEESDGSRIRRRDDMTKTAKETVKFMKDTGIIKKIPKEEEKELIDIAVKNTSKVLGDNVIVKKRKTETFVINCEDKVKREFTLIHYDEDHLALFGDEALIINCAETFLEIRGKFKKNLTYENKQASGFLFDRSDRSNVIDTIEKICKGEIKIKGRGSLLREKLDEVKKIIKDDYREYCREVLEITETLMVCLIWGKNFQYVFDKYNSIIKGKEEEFNIIVLEQYGSTGIIMYTKNLALN